MARSTVGFGEGNLDEIADPLSPAEVDALEAWIGVRLPEDYRSYLIEVSAGGVGPGEGLSLMQRSGDGWNCGTDRRRLDRVIAEPFPTWRADGDTRMVLCGAPLFEENYPNLDEFQAAFDLWAERANAGCRAPPTSREKNGSACWAAGSTVHLRPPLAHMVADRVPPVVRRHYP